MPQSELTSDLSSCEGDRVHDNRFRVRTTQSVPIDDAGEDAGSESDTSIIIEKGVVLFVGIVVYTSQCVIYFLTGHAERISDPVAEGPSSFSFDKMPTLGPVGELLTIVQNILLINMIIVIRSTTCYRFAIRICQFWNK